MLRDVGLDLLSTEGGTITGNGGAALKFNEPLFAWRIWFGPVDLFVAAGLEQFDELLRLRAAQARLHDHVIAVIVLPVTVQRVGVLPAPARPVASVSAR
jgi:hypothetical protein